ncbi:DNA excision repair protein ERCC-8 [Quillaja saponaria]|uniref:DNA excision repair protein ERCC-8 n=1 Tax=Quillaja saponaria TaxID=32244 RepID=A0AAD7LYK6_QUISA|nr:DNA excision repair protein ERCC-8 [Quillaja saponaria]
MWKEIRDREVGKVFSNHFVNRITSDRISKLELSSYKDIVFPRKGDWSTSTKWFWLLGDVMVQKYFGTSDVPAVQWKLRIRHQSPVQNNGQHKGNLPMGTVPNSHQLVKFQPRDLQGRDYIQGCSLVRNMSLLTMVP